MKAAIAIDEWKLSIFSRHLALAGYKYVNTGLLTRGTLVLTVVTGNLEALAEVVLAANTEAAGVETLQ